ncbi:MAG: phage capsid protein [Alphaproteobacteria bacterium]
MPKSVFTPDNELTAIAIGYKNPKENFIADKVFPYVPVGTPDFGYNTYPLAEGFTVPDTKVGRTSKPNSVEFSAKRKNASVQDYGLEVPVPNYDVAYAPKNYNPKGRATEGGTNLILLDRELRAANFFKNPLNFGYKKTLAGNDKISSDDGDPIELLLKAKDEMIMGANTLVLGMDVWTKLRLHPKVVAAVNKNSGTSGVASRQAVAELLEVNEVIVGNSKHNVSKKGQTAQVASTWAGVMSLLHLDDTADTENGVTFGLTARFGERIAGELEDQDMGLRGGKKVRVGESVRELVVGELCGYLFESVL